MNRFIRIACCVLGGLVASAGVQAAEIQQLAQGGGINWVEASKGNYPKGSVIGGKEANGEQLIICLAPFKNGLYPGKVRPAFGGCNVGYAGQEYKVTSYWVAQGQGRWADGSNGRPVPPTSLLPGKDATGAAFYVCRAAYKGGVHPGRASMPRRGCIITWGGREISVDVYDVLTR
jgi:hypothetical protein